MMMMMMMMMMHTMDTPFPLFKACCDTTFEQKTLNSAKCEWEFL